MYCDRCGHDPDDWSEGDEALDALRDAFELLDGIRFDVALGRLNGADLSVALRHLSEAMTTPTMRARGAALIKDELAKRQRVAQRLREETRRRLIEQQTSTAFTSAIEAGADPDDALGAAWRAVA